MKVTIEKMIKRIDDVRVEILNPQEIPATLIANRDVPLEIEGIRELLHVLSLQDTLRQIADAEAAGSCEFWGDSPPGAIERVVVTPDFHKGSGIPIGTVIDARGFVIPKAVGNDVCCGMRLLITDVPSDIITKHIHTLSTRLRSIFFEGERDIPMAPEQRANLLRSGLRGLNEHADINAAVGLWRYYDRAAELRNLEWTHMGGSLPVSDSLDLFEDYIRGSGAKDSRDAQIGSVGGGNHFVEIQRVEEIFDGTTAHHWGIKAGSTAIMIHSGSVGLGHMVGGHYSDVAKQIYPKRLQAPEHDFYVLPTSGPLAANAASYLNAMRAAANFAFANRLFLGLMAVRALAEVLGREVQHKLIFDAPHNLIWENGDHFIHRKGACPALGTDHVDESSPFAYFGIPVIIPGSMGASSYLLAGEGNDEFLSSACHGAGRHMTRSAARQAGSAQYEREVQPLHVVTPIDPLSPAIASRRDIIENYKSRLMEEAPYAYKPISAAIDSIEMAKIARRVSRMFPMMTIKG